MLAKVRVSCTLSCMNTLIETIKKLGDDAAAARWGLTPRAVAAYRRGERRPNHHVVEMLRELEGWSYDQIFADLPPISKRPPDSDDHQAVA